MSVLYHVLLLVRCDAVGEGEDWRRHNLAISFSGETAAIAIAKAEQFGWKINGGVAQCPECVARMKALSLSPPPPSAR